MTAGMVVARVSGAASTWGSLMTVLWLVLIAAVVWAVVHRLGPAGTRPSERAREILAERYARGEISIEEYQERLSNLG